MVDAFRRAQRGGTATLMTSQLSDILEARARLSLGTSNLYRELQQHWPIIGSCHYPGQLLTISADQWKNWGKKKENHCKNCDIKVADIKGRVVNFQTIFIQDHCLHLSYFPQKPKQLTASKSSLPQQTVQTDQDNQDIQTEKSLQISLFTFFLCTNWKSLSEAGSRNTKS